MRAITQKRYGTPDALRLDNIDWPEIAAGEVLVEVRAAGIDRGTWHLMTGTPYLLRLAFGLRGPKNPVPGLDVAGTVAAVGSAVTRFRPGDEVFGISRGSFAEYAAAREDKLAHKPAGLAFQQAAIVPVSGLTALQAVRDVAKVQSGQHVLITGASGGVGTYAVQVAQAFGAEVTGVCSTGKLDLVRSLGADHVLDYTQEDVLSSGQRYDVIIDIAGGLPLRELRRILAPEGRIALVGSEEGGNIAGPIPRILAASTSSLIAKQKVVPVVSKEHYAGIEVLAGLIKDGKLAPVLNRTFPLEEAVEAMRYFEAGKARGKIALTVDPSSRA